MGRHRGPGSEWPYQMHIGELLMFSGWTVHFEKHFKHGELRGVRVSGIAMDIYATKGEAAIIIEVKRMFRPSDVECVHNQFKRYRKLFRKIPMFFAVPCEPTKEAKRLIRRYKMQVFNWPAVDRIAQTHEAS